MNWKKIFDSLGLNGTWWQWRIHRAQERWAASRASLSTRTSNATYQHRLCRICGGLMEQSAATCTRCGAPLENWRTVQLRRAAGMLVPVGLTVSYLLMAANIIVIAAQLMAVGWGNLFNPDPLLLYLNGALVPELVAGGEFWRLLAYAFLHGGLLHIFFNTFSLSQVGPISENEIGRSRFLVVYTLAALGGAAADLVWHHFFGTRPLVVGASGAVFGLIGFGLTYNYFYGSPAGRSNSGMYLQWAVYSFACGFLMPAVDNVCHAGGFLVGMVLGFIIERDLRHGDKFSLVWRVLAVLCVIALLTTLARIFVSVYSASRIVTELTR